MDYCSEYETLLRKLQVCLNSDDDEGARTIQDAMYKPWINMTPEEQDQMLALSDELRTQPRG